MGRVAAVVLDVAEQEVDECGACVLAVEGEAAAWIADLVEGDVAVEEVATEIQQMTLELPADVIAPVPVAVGAVAGADLALEVISVVNTVGAGSAAIVIVGGP